MSKALKIVAGVALIYTGAGIAVGVGALAGASVGTLVAISTAANVLAATTVLGGIARALTPKPRTPGNPGVQQEYAGNVEPVRIVYGTMLVSGMNVIPPITTGTDNQSLHQVLALAGHEITAIDAYYANKTAVTPGAVTGTANDGKVTTGTWADVLWLRGYLGTAAQTADYILTQDASASWTSDHRGRGVAYVAAKFQFDAEKYQNGKPDLTFKVRGKKCYDPRLDPSPGTNTTNASYIAHTANPALIAADYLMDTKVGRKVPASRIDWALVVAAANICDESISGASAPPSGAQVRYTCNVVLSAADDPDENLAVIASAMMGLVYRSGGQWRMYAGAWTSSAFTLTEADVVGEVRVESEIARREKYNAVRGSFLDAATGYEQREFPPVVSSAYATTDGRELWKEMQFACCTDVYEAQRNAIILLRQSRNRRTVQIECALTAFKVRVFETGTITLPEIGWSAQTVRCYGWRFNPAGTVTLTLREEYSADWANPATADYTTPGSVSTPTIGYTRPGTPVSFTATGVIAGIKFALAAGDPFLPGQTYRIYEGASGSDFEDATLVWEGVATQTTLIKTDTTTRDYWVTAAYGANESAPRPTGAGTACAGLGGPVPGAALNRDPDFLDPSAWLNQSTGAALTASDFATITDGVAGNRTLRSGTVQMWITGADRIPVDATKVYRIRGWARRNASANGTLYFGVAAFDSAGNTITGDGTQWSYDAAADVTITTSFVLYEGFIGAGTTNTFPAGARTMAPGILMQYGGSAGYMEMQGVRLEECAPTALLAPGAATFAASTFDAGPISFSNIS